MRKDVLMRSAVLCRPWWVRGIYRCYVLANPTLFLLLSIFYNEYLKVKIIFSFFKTARLKILPQFYRQPTPCGNITS
jgi:hypothetical protein